MDLATIPLLWDEANSSDPGHDHDLRVSIVNIYMDCPSKRLPSLPILEAVVLSALERYHNLELAFMSNSYDLDELLPR